MSDGRSQQRVNLGRASEKWFASAPDAKFKI